MAISSVAPFSLGEHPAKAAPTLIAEDVRHFARISVAFAAQKDNLETRLDALRRQPAESGQAALDRDLEIHRLSARLRVLRRFGLDLCLGRMVDTTGGTLYVGRIALSDATGDQLLIDWRAPAVEPFFGATHANSMGLASRRRYRWHGGRITDYWDEAFTTESLANSAALDDQSAFIASLGASRSPRMRDVLGTIQADQDAIIRADSPGTLVVDGGPGTGKTVVALHRTAYLLYADPILQAGHGGVLFVGPSSAYTAYVSDVLPNLGEDGVRIATLRDLVREGASAVEEQDPQVARIKASAALVSAVDNAVRLRERPPTRELIADTAWGEVRISAADWTEAFGAADEAASHNEARQQAWDALLTLLTDRMSTPASDEHGDADESPRRWDDEGWGDASGASGDDERYEEDVEEPFDAYGLLGADNNEAVRRALTESALLREAFDNAWPLLDPVALVRALWSDPDLLRRCAPWLSAEEATLLKRRVDAPWTRSDLPFLDVAQRRIGDPQAAVRRRRAEAELAAERARMDDVVADLIATDNSDMRVMSMLRGQDLRGALAAPSTAVGAGDGLDGPFAHIVVDEAQELTDAEWQMLLQRNPSRSFTVVGDRAQARHGFVESWQERLEGVGLRDITVASLRVNYRTPREVMREATPVIRAALPDANVPTSVRSSGIAVRYEHITQRDTILDAWTSANTEGVACVIDVRTPAHNTLDAWPRVQALTPEEAKGLEFDLVVLVDPEHWGEGVEGAVDRYVAMTRATKELVVLTGSDVGRHL